MIFETERLILRPRTMDDFDACIAMDNVAGVTDYIQGPWDDAKKHTSFVTDRMNRDYGFGLGYWSIFAMDAPDLFIGWVLLIPEDAIGPDIEIGWRLFPDYWGKGIATEAAHVLMQYAFETLKLPKIVAGIDPRNGGSIGVARKIGMTFRSQKNGYDLYVRDRDAT